MAAGEDFLERVWHEVVNVESKGEVTTENIPIRDQLDKGPLKGAGEAQTRLILQGISCDDLHKFAAFVRWQTCFDVLVALDDPGLENAPIAGIQKEFLAGPKSKPRGPREKFIKWLWDTGNFLDDDGKWLKELTAKELGPPPFNRMDRLVQRLVKNPRGRRFRDLGLFFGRYRAVACAMVLKRLEEVGFKRGDEPRHLHEAFDSSYPPAPIRKRKASPGSPPDPEEPLWKIKPAQAIAFSPDSKTLAVAGASGPVRLYDLATGQQRLVCQGIKVHIYDIVFSPDGKQVTAGQIRKNLSICDSRTGKLIQKLTKRDEEISGLEHAPTGEIICSDWSGDIAVFDSKSGKKLPVIEATDSENMVDAISLFANGTRLTAMCDGQITVWSWPGRKRLREFKAGGWQCKDIAASEQDLFAVAEQEKGVLLIDATTGKQVGLIPVKDLYNGLAFTPDGSHLAVNHHRANQLSIWTVKDCKQVRQLSVNAGMYQLRVSPDGNFLAASTERGAFVWRLSPLLQQ